MSTKRWTRFETALHRSIQDAAHEWTYEDFTECFPLYTSENKESSRGVYNQISSFIESTMLEKMQALFNMYDVKENIDTLHRVITDAKARPRDSSPKDMWREKIDPHAAIAARTIPVLEDETARLRETLAKYQEENARLAQHMEETQREIEDSEAETRRLLKNFSQVLEQWKQVPEDEIEDWVRKTAEELRPVERT